MVKQLETLAAQIKELSVQPSLKDRAAFLVEYFKRTKKVIDETEQAAKKSTEEASAATGGDQ